MGTVVQQCAATGLNKLLSRVEREWAKSSWTDGHVTSTRMMSQKKPLHPQMMTPNLDNTHIPTSSADKKQQRRQKHKPNIPSVKHNTNTSELSCGWKGEEGEEGAAAGSSGTWSGYYCWNGFGSRRFRRRVGECPLLQPVAAVPTTVHPPSTGDSARPSASSSAREHSLLLSSRPCLTLPLPRSLAATLATHPVLGPAAHTPKTATPPLASPPSPPSRTTGAASPSPRGVTVRVGSTLLRRPLGVRGVGALKWGSAT
ncbi:uncharacterized protein LOC121575386 isoform X1 [Coregonus clupeaformis]|uniref:uncharacterized protein LOC121575386 isoform X1 n=1 Tax=Coregonus clupeaformis TaxID=59861 RepID=UPI001BDFB13F|nr:uncharacterized protein LOC121575386 isoform X1 [Coregonus clupeaformis]